MTNAANDVTALTVKGLSFEKCFGPPVTFNVSMFFDPPRSLQSGGASGSVAIGDRGEFELHLTEV